MKILNRNFGKDSKRRLKGAIKNILKIVPLLLGVLIIGIAISVKSMNDVINVKDLKEINSTLSSMNIDEVQPYPYFNLYAKIIENAQGYYSVLLLIGAALIGLSVMLIIKKKASK